MDTPAQTPDGIGRQEAAAFATYDDAQAAADRLVGRNFPVGHLSIVADRVRVVERVLGNRRYKDAIVQGVLWGASLGGVLGFLFGVLGCAGMVVSDFSLTLYGSLSGAAAGALVGTGQAVSTRRRDFSSASSMEADRYVVLSDSRRAEDASRRLRTQ